MTVYYLPSTQMKSEKEVQKEIIKYVKANGGWIIKVLRANENGCPDLLIAINGIFVGCEVKAERFENNPEKQMSPWQHKHKNMILASASYFVCAASLEQFKDYLEDSLIYF